MMGIAENDMKSIPCTYSASVIYWYTSFVCGHTHVFRTEVPLSTSTLLLVAAKLSPSGLGVEIVVPVCALLDICPQTFPQSSTYVY